MSETITARRTSTPVTFAALADLIPGVVGGTEGVGVLTSLRDLIQANLTTAVASVGYDISTDVKLRRDAANTLSLINGTNAQAFHVYNTEDTSLTNYERGVFKWDTDVLEIGMEHAGTGIQRNVQLHRGGIDHIKFNGKVLLQRDIIVSSNITMSEASAPPAPGANDGKLFLVDSGSGKTELRIIFATGASVLIASEP